VRVHAVALLALVQLAATSPVSAGSLRHVEYSFNSSVHGAAQTGTIRLDLTAVNPDRSFAFDVADDSGSDDARAFQVSLDRMGSVDEDAAGALREEDEALLYFFSLSHENVAGVDPGDHWVRSCANALGSQETNYAVLSLRKPIVDLGVTRVVTRVDGEVTIWRGHVLYDVVGAVPTLVELRGTSSNPALDGKSHERNLKINLTSDSFKHE
jgi:hypothetical protein